MEKDKKGRLIKIAGIAAVALIVVLGVIGANTGVRTVLLTDAPEITDGSRIIVTACVKDDSYAVKDGVLTFELYDPANDPEGKVILPASYAGDVPVTFGNGVRILCTGVMDDAGVLVCSELTINQPAEYASAEGASTVADLLAAGDSAIGKSTKVIGIMQDGPLASVDADVRFTIADEAADGSEPAQLKVRYNGYLADKMNGGSHLVLTGSLAKDGIFDATKVELQE